jgi:Fe-S oxidoreductase
VFRDELVNLLPNDQDARRLADLTCTLDQLLARRESFEWPALRGRAVVQGHCHHKSVLGFAGEQAALGRLGLELAEPEPGCCGMAGAFGFEAGAHYDVARTCGERALLPAVRQADPGTLIVADGFSCREQIAQGTGRRALHLAEVLDLAIAGADGRALPSPPERRIVGERRIAERRSLSRAALAGSAVGGVLLGLALHRRAQ